MKWVRDKTHRFELRPYFDQYELDSECERIVSDFLRAKNGLLRYPLSTDDLEVLIERDTSELDLYADLSAAGDDVEGETRYFTHKKPSIRISQLLSLDASQIHRLRTTLAHEYAHVCFHAFLWLHQTEQEVPQLSSALTMSQKISRRYRRFSQLRQSFATDQKRASRLSCAPPQDPSGFRSSFQRRLSDLPEVGADDWMEWQAAYAAGAFLMPLTAVRDLLSSTKADHGQPVSDEQSECFSHLTTLTAHKFDVSLEAAHRRLQKLQYT